MHLHGTINYDDDLAEISTMVKQHEVELSNILRAISPHSLEYLDGCAQKLESDRRMPPSLKAYLAQVKATYRGHLEKLPILELVSGLFGAHNTPGVQQKLEELLMNQHQKDSHQLLVDLDTLVGLEGFLDKHHLPRRMPSQACINRCKSLQVPEGCVHLKRLKQALIQEHQALGVSGMRR
jgi:hypothetical protein